MTKKRLIEIAVKVVVTHRLPDGHHHHELHGLWTVLSHTLGSI